MTKPNMTYQWDSGNFTPLDMSKIPGYPRQMPPKYEKWLHRFTGSYGERLDYHMSNFLAFFQLHPISDDAEVLVMNLFSATLHGNARRWYDNIPAASVTSIDQLEETFLMSWGMKLEDIQLLLKGLEYIRQTEDETARDFEVRFQMLLYQIPRSYCPEDKYLVYLYTNALLGHLSFLLNKKGPKTLTEAYSMAIKIEANISLFREGHPFTLDAFSLERLVSLEIFTENSQERREQVFNKHIGDMVEELEPKQNDEVSTCAPPSDKAIHEPSPLHNNKMMRLVAFLFRMLFHDSESEGGMDSLKEVDLPCYTIEDEGAVHEDETMTHVEDTQVLKAPARQEETSTVSYPPLQNINDFLRYDLGSEEEMDEPLKFLNPPCYDTDTNIVDINEFIHVGRRRWDVVAYDMDPIYDIENHFQVLPSQLSQHDTFDFDQW
jgi:hypothetical protein